MAGPDAELEEYRQLMLPPEEYEDGFNTKTILGIFFITFIMLPSSIYLGLMVGASMGPAAVWVTIILFSDIARRSFKPLKKQEIYMLYYVAASLAGMAGGTALAGGPFAGLIWNQYFRHSVAAGSMGISEAIPNWVAPVANSPALLDRTFLHADWGLPILLLVVGGILGRLSWITAGYSLFRLTSDVEKLPFPMAPIAASGATALAETGREGWRWRTFSIGAMIGVTFGIIYIFIPALSGAVLGTPIVIIPIPWVDLTTRTETILPAAATGIAFNLGSVILGMVLPFSIVIGRFMAAMVHMFLNPVLYKVGVLNLWHPGLNTIMTEFLNGIDFWLSFGIGTSFAVAFIGFGHVIKAVRKARAERGSAEGGSWAEVPPGRGDFSVKLALVIFALCTLGYIGLCLWLVGATGYLVFFFFFFGFVYTPLISYVNARLVGLAGQHLGFPMIREATFILSGYKGAAIWFAPFPMRNYGGTAQRFREIELTGTKFTSIIKAEIFMFPVVLLASFIFWSYIWGSGPKIPSNAYPFANMMWDRAALRRALWISSTVTGGESFLYRAISFPRIFYGLGFGLSAYFILSAFNMPTLLLYGFIAGMATLPHFIIPELIGALLGRYYFLPRFGRKAWRRATPVLMAGFACGMGLIGMGGVAIALLSAAVRPKPW